MDAMSGPDTVRVAVRGRLSSLRTEDEARLFDRGRATDPAVEAAVREIVRAVRERGDDALRELARRFDGAELVRLEVPAGACAAALEGLDPAVRAGLEEAAAAIAAFHRAQLPPPLEVEVRPGVRLGRRAEPLGRVGVYAPGGRAAYPSSVLMGVVPARVAGVGEVVVCSPPGPDGRPPAAVLAACALAGADRVFALGGAGAVAAMALGTEGVPAVDRIVGPGNAYVTEAKRQLTGVVAIDCPAGPSEVLIVADAAADPELAALEMLAQAEHDPDAAAVLVATDEDVAARAAAALERLAPVQARGEIIRSALAARGGILVAADLDEALAFATRYAPEHLLLLVREPRRALDRVRAAGTTFLGAPSSVAFGDYVTGANHVLPTAGLARAYAGLSTADFLRWSTYQEVSAGAAAALAGPTVALAEAEGLPAHAAAAAARAPDPAAGADARAAASRRSPGAGAAEAAVPALRPRPFRAAYRDIRAYDPGRLPTPVDLSDNTNLWGVPPAARRVLDALPRDRITRYPSVYADELRAALAERHGLPASAITTGCGSDDLIDSAVRAFGEPGDVLAYPSPTFGVVPTFGRMNALRAEAVPFAPGFRLEPAALLARRPRIVYLCRPNNPTGTSVDAGAVRELADGMADAAGVLLLDEAYADFAPDSLLEWAVGRPNVVVLRTLSKAWGLAGLRLGYAAGAPELIAEVEKSRGPYKVTAVSEAAAAAALREDAAWMAARVADAVATRERLRSELEARGVRVWPSAANFLLVAADGGGAADLAAALRNEGVQVRPFADLPEAGEAVRVTVGPWPLMERFLEALDAIRGRAVSGR